MKTRLILSLVVCVSSLCLSACTTTGPSNPVVATSDTASPLGAAVALASAGGDVLSGSFGHEAIGASQLNLAQNEKARRARAQADYDYRSYVVWKGSQKSE